MVDPIARPDMMGDRPARDHHHADDHLHVLRLAVAAVAVPGEVVRARALEVGAGDVVEDQLGLETEEVAEPAVQRTSIRSLAAKSWSRVRYQASSWRGWTRTRRRWCQWGTKRRPFRSQTKSVSSQPASPCSLAGATSRLATRTKARSANGTPLACPRY